MDILYLNYFVEDDEGIKQPQQNFKYTTEKIHDRVKSTKEWTHVSSEIKPKL